LINQSYSRDFEREADSIGYRLLVETNIDPQGLTRFFKKIFAEEKLAFTNINDERNRHAVIDSMVFLRSHPTTEERIKHLQHMALKRQESFRDLSAEFDQLQLAVKQFVTSNTPEEIHNGSSN